ncbi:MAG: thioredoxin domain-containing protein [Ignavibacteriae bacterium]|nr:MAG: thioredoxin domain-containing protein [Ignavibacteriota bacterium]
MKTNNLINEKSPYLLQHAYNPVDWFAWSNEAFNKAKAKDKPIFLSIGYSTCHWCHVMERESFEDEEVAKILNENFISIKVDREERPDIDHIYMQVCHMLNRSGGWPLNLFLTPDKKPFFAGTYFPKNSVYNRIGFIQLMEQIIKLWKEKRNEIYNSANSITEHLNFPHKLSEENKIHDKIFIKTFNDFRDRFDKNFGGFGNSPKFPSPHNLIFLLKCYLAESNSVALDMVNKTLTEMRKGGVYDHIGFGFHRYSTDEKWFLPHFEKMMYDQAMLIIAYSEAYQITMNDLYKKTVYEIATYLLRDMTSKEGGFYSAEDADSEGVEGKFYVWKYDRIFNILEENEAEFFVNLFNISKAGNYFEEVTGKQTGENIPHLNVTLSEFAEITNASYNKVLEKVETARKKLFDVREKRVHPLKDDKILTDWNGLTIAALAKASKIFNDNEFLKAVENSANFITTNLYKNNNLFHRFREGESAVTAKLDDYAFLIWGFIELFENTYNAKYLKLAIELCDYAIKNFWDNKDKSGFFFTSINDENLITRSKEFYDGAIPSGNSVMYCNLIKLHKITNNNNYQTIADNLELSFLPFLENAPTGFAQFLSGFLEKKINSQELIIVGEQENEEIRKIFAFINDNPKLNVTVILITNKNRNALLTSLPYLKDYNKIDGKPTFYLCENFSCNTPTNKVEEIIEKLKM